jgi:biopolymer transport protein ExbD
MAHALTREDSSPILDMNTTPLIDVLLVLLVMFIITLPIQTHAVKVDLPPPGQGIVVERLKNEVAITASGQILWNGQAVSQPELAGLLVRSQALDPVPELHLRPDAEARYDIVDQVLATTKRAHVQNVGFVGNDAYAGF